MNDHSHMQIINHSTNAQQLPHSEGMFSFDLMIIFKIIFYLIFIVKIIELSFLRRKKFSLKERIYRKFLFAHQDLLRHFTDEDKSIMQTTLSNTMKNASIEFDPKNSKIRKAKKHVNIKTNLNRYYNPKNWNEEQEMRQERQKKEHRNKLTSTTFQEKKIEDQFIERQDLLGLSQIQDNLLPLQSRIAQPNVSQELRQKDIASDLIDVNDQS